MSTTSSSTESVNSIPPSTSDEEENIYDPIHLSEIIAHNAETRVTIENELGSGSSPTRWSRFQGSRISSALATSSCSVSNQFSSVVQMARKAALDTRHKMGPAADKISLIHYNDVYTVASGDEEPVGGAARFCSAIKSFQHLNPMVVFSGDIFAPSTLSTFTKGDQMVPVLNHTGTKVSVYGNHDFDFGIDKLMELREKTNCVWLMSNVVDHETGRPLAEGKVFHIQEWCGRKVGFIGLVEKEWLDTLSTINPGEVTFTDYVEAGSMLAKELKHRGCDIVIALTHMRTPNDVRLAESVSNIDIILGGHDHVYENKKVNGIHILKSGTEFKNFTVVTVDFSESPIHFNFDKVDITSKYDEDPELKEILSKFQDKIEVEMCKELGEFNCDLDGRFSSIRTQETNLGNFVCDIMVASTSADFALLNSGTFRSDRVHSAGPFFLKDLCSILPMIDPLVLLNVSGAQVLKCLENGVSQWPKLEGRFPQVSGIQFAFDPSKPPGSRVDEQFVKIGDEYLKKSSQYRMVTKAYLAMGKDGYDTLTSAETLIDEETGPQLTYAVQNHFKAIAMKEGRTRRSSIHHQSLVTLSRRSSLVRQFTLDGKNHLPTRNQSSAIGNEIEELEDTALTPKIARRIIKIDNDNLYES
uniref:AGAP007730PAlike [Tribolium castaneum] n=3 Tax=Lepeophtheirus salmonis TaxID=72036 RepID=A0A0K2SW39_LEPSM